MYPLLLKPDIKERVWGGSKLRELFKKEIPSDSTGESWEAACHDNGSSIIINGIYAGKSLSEVYASEAQAVLGYEPMADEKFPLLVKLIDAREKLSVQVHPDDAYAKLYENGELGKSEAWYILAAEESASLIVGLKEGVTRDDFIEALKDGRLEQVLNELPVKAGDVIDIPAGLVHAIGGGIVLAEVQQNSDTTYRVYDWGRVGLDGKARELHIDKSIQVIDFDGRIPTKLASGTVKREEGVTVTTYIDNQYFKMDHIHINGIYMVKDGVMKLLTCIEGNGQISFQDEQLRIQKGQTVLIPGSIDGVSITGELTFIGAVPKRSML